VTTSGASPEPYPWEARDWIPEDELERVVDQLFALREQHEPEVVRERYERLGVTPSADPTDEACLAPIARALAARTPLSVIRVGDAEAAVMTYGTYPGTPRLDRYGVARSVLINQDSFRVHEAWMPVLRDWLRWTVEDADLLGVLGCWRPKPIRYSREVLRDRILANPRGRVGHFRGVDFMLRWVERAPRRPASVATAHLYFGVVAMLDELVSVAESVLLITDKTAVVEAMRKRYPGKAVEHLAVGRSTPEECATRTGPSFLEEIERQLPDDLRGCLALVGSGLWAQIYCSWIKRRGGVAVDIGSGFDLMQGTLTRPMHKAVPEELIRRCRIC
jgi:hypothetical protein